MLAAENFEEHMDASVVWFEDPAYAEAFADIVTTEERDTMTAHTNAVDPRTGAHAAFPAYINIRFEGGRAIITARGDPELVEGDADNTSYYKAAKTVELTLEQHDWDQFVAEATRERGLVPGG